MRKLAAFAAAFLITAGIAAVALGDDASPSFTFATGETGATYQCSLDGAAPADCSSPKAYSNLDPGQHTVDVTASFTVPTPPPPPPPPPTTSVLFGDQNIASVKDYNPSGVAQAFKYTSSNAGSLTDVKLYVDAGTTATKLYLGVYADANGKPGSLLASGSVSSLQASSWVDVPVGSAAISSGSSYWIALLGTGGEIHYVDSSGGSATASYVNSQRSLTSLPSTYAPGTLYNVSPASAYVLGTSTPPPPPPPPVAPANTASPSISGTPQQGSALTADPGAWSGDTPITYSYSWSDGQSGKTITLGSADVGQLVSVTVTALNDGGSATATSSSVGPVAAAPPPTGNNCAGVAGSKTVSQSALDSCGLPSMNTTGPPAGTTFTNSNGFTASTPGQVYSGLNINGEISITASNVTIQNSNLTDVNPNTAAIRVASGVTGVKILNDSIHGTNAVQSGSLAFAVSYSGSSITGVTIDRTNFYNGDRILAGGGTVTNSYCLGGAHFNSGGSEEHDECIYSPGNAPGVRAIHDTLINANPDQTAAIFVDNPDYGGQGANGILDVENSLVAGGDYCIYGGDGKGKTPKTGKVTITGNRFSRLFWSLCGNYGPDAYTPNGMTWSGNVWDDTGASVSP